MKNVKPIQEQSMDLQEILIATTKQTNYIGYVINEIIEKLEAFIRSQTDNLFDLFDSIGSGIYSAAYMLEHLNDVYVMIHDNSEYLGIIDQARATHWSRSIKESTDEINILIQEVSNIFVLVTEPELVMSEEIYKSILTRLISIINNTQKLYLMYYSINTIIYQTK